MENTRKVGLGVMIFKDGKVLVGKRYKKTDVIPGQFAFPGGHMEYGESFEDCCVRETREETGIEIDNLRFVMLGNVMHYTPGHHYLQVGFVANWKSGEPKTMEPDKCGEWQWIDPKDFPEDMMIFSKVLYKSYLSGQKYFPDIS